MKITLTQKSEVRPLSDDETEVKPENALEFEVIEYITISANFQTIAVIDLDGKPRKIKIIGVGAARIDLSIINQPKALIKVVLDAQSLELLPIEPIPCSCFFTYKVIPL